MNMDSVMLQQLMRLMKENHSLQKRRADVDFITQKNKKESALSAEWNGRLFWSENTPAFQTPGTRLTLIDEEDDIDDEDDEEEYEPCSGCESDHDLEDCPNQHRKTDKPCSECGANPCYNHCKRYE